jgi:hypothetical protein
VPPPFSGLQDGSGTIEYEEFRKVWSRVSNVRQELINRGVTDFPKWAPKATLAQMLEDIIIEEEKREVLCGLLCAVSGCHVY